MVIYRIAACVGLCLQFLETGSQLWAAVEYYQTLRLTTWFVVLTVIILLPLFVTNIVSLALVFKQMDFEEKCLGRLVCCGFHFVQFGQLWRLFKLLLAYDVIDCKEFSVLRLGQFFTGSTIFVVVQCYLMVTLNHWSVAAIISLVASLLSGASVLMLYSTPRSIIPGSSLLHLQGVVRFLWAFFMLLSRFVALAMFTATLNNWVILVIGCHWAVMFLWSQAQEIFLKKDAKEKTCLSRCGDAARCYVMCFDLLSVTHKRKWKVLFVYYTIILAENALMIIVWFTGLTNPSQRKDWYAIPSIVTVFFSFICGFIFMLINFKCFTNNNATPVTFVANESDLKDILSNLDYIHEDLIWDTFGDVSARSYNSCERSPTFLIVPKRAVHKSTVVNRALHESVASNSSLASSVDKPTRKKRQLPQIPQQNSRTNLILNKSDTFDVHQDTGSVLSLGSTDVTYHKLSNGVERSSSNSRNTHTLDTSLPSSISESPEAKPFVATMKITNAGRKLPVIPGSGGVSAFDDAQCYELESCVTIKSEKHGESVESLYQSGQSSSSGTPDDFTITKSRGFDYHGNQWEIESNNSNVASDSDFAMTWPPSNPKFTIENLTNIPNMTSDPYESVSAWLERINKPCRAEVSVDKTDEESHVQNSVGTFNETNKVVNGVANGDNSQVCNADEDNRGRYSIGHVKSPPLNKKKQSSLINIFRRFGSLHSDLGERRTKSKKKKKKFRQMEQRMIQRQQRPRRVISIESMV